MTKAVREEHIWIVSGDFGRAVVNTSARALTEHAHAQVNMIFWLGGGTSRMRLAGRDVDISKGSALLLNPWQPHAKLSDEQYPAEILSLLIEPEWIRSTVRLPTSSYMMFPLHRVELDDEIIEKVRSIARAIKSTESTKRVISALVDLVGFILMQHAVDQAEHERRSGRRPADYRIQRAIDYIQTSVGEVPRIDDIAARVGLSRSHFFERFRRCIGASPHAFVDWARLEIAVEWLSNPDALVAELSDSLGFSEPSHFCRFFSRHLGIPPSEYRRRMRTTPAVCQQDMRLKEPLCLTL